MASILRRRPTHPDGAEVFGWPFGPDARPLAERLFGLRDDMIRVEEFSDGSTEVIRAEVPGVDPSKDVEVSISEGMLSLRVERREETREKAGDGYRSEFRYGALSRTVPLPAGVKEDEISATYNDGILEIRIPVEEVAKPAVRKVDIKHG